MWVRLRCDGSGRVRSQWGNPIRLLGHLAGGMGLSWAACAVGERESSLAGGGFQSTRIRENENAFPFTNPFIKPNQFESKIDHSLK
jgi:hypothetical protein